MPRELDNHYGYNYSENSLILLFIFLICFLILTKDTLIDSRERKGGTERNIDVRDIRQLPPGLTPTRD